MNPLNWSRNLQVALILAIAIGAMVGTVLGYLVYASAQGADGGISFQYWVRHPLRYAGLWWGVFGAAIGVGFIYLKRLTSNQPPPPPQP